MATRIIVEQVRLGGWPALHAAPAERLDAPLPTVWVYHGFTRDKELDSNLAVMLAQAGLRAVLPEVDGHGERFNGDSLARRLRFWNIVRGCIDEWPQLQAEVAARGWIDPGRVAVAGLSMGGFVALGALARHATLRAGVSWMGSGYFLDLARTLYPPLGHYDASTAAAHEAHMASLAPYDPSARLERLADRPLLLWHGVRDEVVPFHESARLHAQLVRRGGAHRLEFLADPEAAHKLNAAGVRAGVDFLRRVL
jgi:fermentation-respiration switch protein FrsA (DUF1100 family)